LGPPAPERQVLTVPVKQPAEIFGASGVRLPGNRSAHVDPKQWEVPLTRRRPLRCQCCQHGVSRGFTHLPHHRRSRWRFPYWGRLLLGGTGPLATVQQRSLRGSTPSREAARERLYLERAAALLLLLKASELNLLSRRPVIGDRRRLVSLFDILARKAHCEQPLPAPQRPPLLPPASRDLHPSAY
jgi:hypothetical protein